MDRLAAALGGFESADGGDASALADEAAAAEDADGSGFTPPWRGIGFVRIDGSVDPGARQAAVRPSTLLWPCMCCAAGGGVSFLRQYTRVMVPPHPPFGLPIPPRCGPSATTQRCGWRC